MAWTTYLKNKMLDHLYTDTAYTPPATLYLALSTTTPAADGTGVTEPVGGSYARKAVAASDMSSASSGSKTNSAQLEFVTPTGSWGTITHLCLYDASTSGNLLMYSDCPDRTISSGDSPIIAASALTHTIS